MVGGGGVQVQVRVSRFEAAVSFFEGEEGSEVLRLRGSRGWARNGKRGSRLLGGSWDLVTRVIIKVTILIITYNPT